MAVKWKGKDYLYPVWENPSDLPFREWSLGDPMDNLFCLVVGQKCEKNLKGVLTDVFKGLSGIFTHALGFVINMIPIPGIEYLSVELQQALRDELREKAFETMNKIIETGLDQLGASQLAQHLNVPTYIPSEVLDDWRRHWYGMFKLPGKPDDLITVRHLQFINHAFQYLSNPPWYQKFIVRQEFDDSQGSTHYLQMMICMRYLLASTSVEMKGGGNPPPDGKEFFFDEGVGYWLASLTKGFSPLNSDHVKKLINISRMIGMLEVTGNKQEYEDWKNQIKQYASSQKEQISKKMNAAAVLLGGLAVLKGS